ncbi:GreA/GreB family elongation factor [Pseudoneobacillus sp. C159]
MNHNLQQVNSDFAQDYFRQQFNYIEKNIQDLNLIWQEKGKSQRFFDVYLLHLKDCILGNGQQLENNNVLIGSKITVQYLDDEELESYTICFPEQIDPDNGKISIFSPIGRQLLLKELGQEISLEIPTGALGIKIVQIDHCQA